MVSGLRDILELIEAIWARAQAVAASSAARIIIIATSAIACIALVIVSTGAEKAILVAVPSAAIAVVVGLARVAVKLTQPKERSAILNKSMSHVLLIGDGYAGKTQLIHSLANRPKFIDVEDRTEGFVITKEAISGVGDVQFYDYRGQDFGHLADMLRDIEKKGDRVNVVVFVFDLFGPPSRGDRDDLNYKTLLEDERYKKHQEIDVERVEHQLIRVSSGVFDVIFRSLYQPGGGAAGLEGLCIFVNKVDKLDGWPNRDLAACIREKFDPVRDDLKARAPWADVSLLIGSAINGEAVGGPNGLGARLVRWIGKGDHT